MNMRSCAALVLLGLAAPALAQYAPFTSAPPPATSLSGNEVLGATQNGRGVTVTLAQIAALGGGTATPTALNVSAIGRDGAGRVTSFTSSGTPYTVTYDAFGPATIAGGGKTTTVTRSAQGAVTGISTQ